MMKRLSALLLVLAMGVAAPVLGAGIKVDYFPGVRLDTPMPTAFNTGEKISVKGTLSDTRVTQVLFDFSPATGGESLSFYLKVTKGRFEWSTIFGRDQAGTYTLSVYAGKGGKTLDYVGEYASIKVTDVPRPAIEAGVLALSLLPGTTGVVPLLNRGDGPLQLAAPQISGSFALSGQLPTIAPGKSGQVSIIYNGKGGDAGELVLRSKDPIPTEVKVALIGLNRAARPIDLKRLRADAKGRLSVPLDFGASDYVLAFYSAQRKVPDERAVHRFSLGGPLPVSKPVIVSPALSQGAAFQAQLRQREREIAARLKGREWRAAKRAAVNYRVGDRRVFQFPESNQDAFNQVPGQAISATVVALNERAVAWVQDKLRPNKDNASAAEIKAAIDGFRDQYDWVVRTYGAPSDVDGDGKISFLITHLVDDVGIAGFYSASSVLEKGSGGDGNLTDLTFISPTSGVDYSTMVHEVVHLVVFNQHVLVRGGEGEESWLNEGLAYLSEDLLSQQHDTSALSDFLANPAATGLYGNYYAADNPGIGGAVSLFMHSLLDRLGQGILLRLVQTGLSDVDNIEEATGEKFEDLLAFWTTQLYTSGNGLTDYPRLSFSSSAFGSAEGRTFPLPATLNYQAGGAALAGTLRPRGVNYVRVSGTGTRTVEVQVSPGGAVGVVVLPVPRDFAPRVVVPVDWFSGLVLDQPLPARLNTGQELVLSGTVADKKLTQMQISFTPEGSGESLTFPAEIRAGRFESHLVFLHSQARAYTLNIFAGGKDPNLSSLGGFSPFQVNKGTGPIQIPARFFPGLVLDQPLPASISTGQELVVSGTLTDKKLTQIALSFQPEKGGKSLDFFTEVRAGRFASKISFAKEAVGTYALYLYAGMAGQSLAYLASFAGFQVTKPASTTVAAPAAPTLVTPANNSTGAAVNPTLQWQAVSGATSYTFQLADNARFGTVLFERKGLTSTSIALTGLLAQQRYFWRVNASSSTGAGPWSAVWSFTTAGANPAQWTVFTPSNSRLPGDGIYALAVDADGTKWLGTSGGLARFDGSRWTSYTTANSQIPADSVFAVAVEANGTKWIGTYGLGLGRFDGSKWTTYNSNNSQLPGDWVFALAVEGSGIKWIGTNGGLVRLEGSRWTIYNTGNSSLPGDEVYALAVEANGTKWIGTNGGLARFDGSKWTTYTTASSPLPADLVFSLAIEPKGTKWIGTSGGLARFDGSKWTTYTTANSSLPGDVVYAIAVETSGTKWVGTFGQGLARLDGSKWTTYTAANSSLPGDEVYALAVDKSGAKWIGTSGGLALLSGGSSGTTGKPVVGQVPPATLSLGPNYPNPFNPTTTLSYALPQAGEVELAIYNLAGQRVRLLAQGYSPAGQHTAVWDGRDEQGREVASGVYFSRLELVAPHWTQTRPMLLLR